MAASRGVLAATEPISGIGRVGKGRRIAILGDMLDLGPTDIALHAAIADDPAMPSLDLVHTVGPRMRALHEALSADRRGRWTETADEMARDVHHLIDAGDVLLVKGSKGSLVSRVVDAVRKLGQAKPPDD